MISKAVTLRLYLNISIAHLLSFTPFLLILVHLTGIRISFGGSIRGGLTTIARRSHVERGCLPRPVPRSPTVFPQCGVCGHLYQGFCTYPDGLAFVINNCGSPRKAGGNSILEFLSVWNACPLPYSEWLHAWISHFEAPFLSDQSLSVFAVFLLRASEYDWMALLSLPPLETLSAPRILEWLRFILEVQ